MYIAIAILLYLAFAVLVGRFCSLNTRWERAVGDLPESESAIPGGRLPEHAPLGWPDSSEKVAAGTEAEASSMGVHEDTPVGVST